jgi:transposase
MFRWVVEIVKRNETGKFVVLPKRWIVERTFAWLTFSRRLVRDYEINPRQSEAMIKLAMIRLLLKRLA